MNSTELQKKFPEVYRDFFSKNDLVMSGCFSFPWGPRSIGGIFNKLILKSCLPLRCYVGVKERNDGKIVFSDAKLFSSRENSFLSFPIDGIIKNIDTIIPPLQEFLKDH